MPTTRSSSSKSAASTAAGESKGRGSASRQNKQQKAAETKQMVKAAPATASSSSSSATRVSSRTKTPTRKVRASDVSANESASSTTRKRTTKRKEEYSDSEEEETHKTLEKERWKGRQSMKDISDEDDDEVLEKPRSRARKRRRVSTTATASRNVPMSASATKSSRKRTSVVISNSNVQDMEPVEKDVMSRYSTIDDVWGRSDTITIEDLGQLDETGFFRTVTAANNIQERRTQSAKEAYIATIENIQKNGDPASNATRSDVPTATRNALFPTDIFGTDPGHLAHLIPHGPTAVASYWFVIPFLFNTPTAHELSNTHWTREQCSRLLNGTLSSAGTGNTRRRLTGTGLKHLNLNKISLHGQADHYDKDPHVIIVPIMTIQEMKDFDGAEGYEAIVVTGFSNSGIMAIDEGKLGKKNRMIESLTLLNMYEGPRASESELEIATNLLCNMLRAILKVKHNRMGKGIKDKDKHERERTILPVLHRNKNLQVAKVRFGAPHEEDCHPAPDPVLLTVKAAVNFSRRHGLSLAAQAEPPEDEEEEKWGELDQLAAEQFMEWRERLIKPPGNFHDLAAGLGQHDAIRPDDWGIDTNTTLNRGYQSLMPNVRALLDLE